MRRWADTDRADAYARALAHYGEGDHEPPAVWERRAGDLVDPTRSGRAVDVVNGVSRATGQDTAAWTLDRLLSMAATVAHSRQGVSDPED